MAHIRNISYMQVITPKDIKSGMHIKVYQRIKEGEKERVQAFEGLVIKRRGGLTSGATFTVRKKSGNVFVEKIFPIQLPTIEKIELIKKFPVRRAQITYMRDPHFKPKKKAIAVADFVVATKEEVPAGAAT